MRLKLQIALMRMVRSREVGDFVPLRFDLHRFPWVGLGRMVSFAPNLRKTNDKLLASEHAFARRHTTLVIR